MIPLLTPAERARLIAAGAMTLPDAPAPAKPAPSKPKPYKPTPPGPCSHRPPLNKRTEASGAALDAILDRALALSYHGRAVPLMRLAVEANMPMGRFREKMAERARGKH